MRITNWLTSVYYRLIRESTWKRVPRRRRQSRSSQFASSALVIEQLESRQLLSATTTVVTDTSSTIQSGQTETFTATVTSPGGPVTSGSVTFYDGSTVLAGPINLSSNGTASYTTSSLPAGLNVVTAIYNGAGGFSNSSSTLQPSSIIQDVAGNGTAGSAGDSGQATAGEIYFPTVVAFDAAGDMFIGGTNAGRIREVNATTHVITTYAGGGTLGEPGGTDAEGDGLPATQGVLADPTGLAFDAAGDLFIADSVWGLVHEVNATTHIMTLVAGGGFGNGAGATDTFGDGTLATLASFSFASNVAVDAAGDVFITDSGHNLVREVNATTQIITVVAGGGTGTGAGATDAFGDGLQATAAKLNNPNQIAFGPDGNLYIADANDNLVREVNLTTNVITAVAGNGTDAETGDTGQATAASLNDPEGVAFDASGDMFISDSNSAADPAVIREVNASTGVITTIAGGANSTTTPNYGNGGPASAAYFTFPEDIAFDANGNLYVADTFDMEIREIVSGTATVTVTNAPPTITTPTAVNISGTTATLGGDVTLNGGLNITARGVLYSLSSVNPDPLFGGVGVINVPDANPSVGVFTENVGNLIPGATYSYVAYATNSLGTTYTAPVMTFVAAVAAPSVSSPTSSNVTSTTATAGGTVTSAGSNPVTATGIVYSLTSVNSNPQIGGNGVTTVPEAGGLGAFTANLANLIPGASYSFAAYATNSNGTSYTTPVSTFTTIAALQEVTSPTATNITGSSALLGGTVPSSTSAFITETGVVYAPTSVNPNPNFGGTGVSVDTSTGKTGAFGINTTGLTPGVNYSFIAFAIDSNGQLYTSPAATFTTQTVSTTTTLTVPPGSIVYSQLDPFTATVSSSAGPPNVGVVTFYDGATVLGSPVPVVNGVAILQSTTLPVGLNTVTAVYTDQVGFITSTSNQVNVNVTIATPTVTAVDPSGPYNGSPFTATVSAVGFNNVVAPGTATFTYYQGSGTNGPVLATAPTQPGTYTVVATFTSTTANFKSGTSAPLVFVITQALTTTAVNVTAGTISYGQPESLTATVSSQGVTVNSGTVTFYNGNTPLGAPVAVTNGTASLTPNLPVGLYVITAKYSGTTDFTSSSSILGSNSVVKSVAGNGTQGSSGNNDQATSAELNVPFGIAFDATGDMFIADSGANVIREVNATTHVITTVVGTGTAGYSGDNGQASAAKINGASSIAFDQFGNLFIDDRENNVIREVNATSHIITTIAGNGISGKTGNNVPATSAELNHPFGIATDSSGDLFIADSGNNMIREVNATTHVITTVAGNGTSGYSGDNGAATAAKLNNPYGITIDTAGDLFIADSDNNVVREVNATTQVITTIAGNGAAGNSGNGGQATLAELHEPTAVAVDLNGDVFIADSFNYTVREVYAISHVINAVAGTGITGFSGDNGPATAAKMNRATDIALDAAGELFFADAYNSVIREVSGKVFVQVNPATPTVVAIDAGGTDNGTPYAATYTATGVNNAPVNGTATFTYYQGSGTNGPVLKSAPINPGTYTVVAVFTSSDPNYKSVSSPAHTFVITPAAAPVLAGYSGTGTYVKGSAPMPIAPNVVVTDAAGVNIASATITITNWVSNEDRLNFYNSAALQHTFVVNSSTNTAVLTLTGSATAAAYQTELQSITYQDVNFNVPVLTARGVSIVVSDGTSNSNTLSGNVTVHNVDMAPTLSAIESAPLVYTPNTPPKAISATLLVNDPDSANLMQATVQITAGYQNNANGKDMLSFTNQNGITGSFNATTGTLTLTGTSSVSNYRTALRSVTFSTTGNGVSLISRTLTITASDDGGMTSLPITRNVSIATAPILSGLSSSETFIKGSALLPIAPNLSITEVVPAAIASATITITNWASNEDRLSFYNSAALQHTLTVNTTTNTAVLTLTGIATAAAYQTELQSLMYQDVNNNLPVLTARQVTISITDIFSNTTTATTNISVQNVNLPPVLSNIESTPLTYSANTGLVSITTTLSIGDPDTFNLANAVIQITSGYQNTAGGHDELTFAPQNGITGTFTQSTGTLVLSGASSLSNYQAALKSVTFSTSGTAISTANRTLTITVTDSNSVTSVPVTRTIAVSAAPLISGMGGSETFVKGSVPMSIAPTLALSDAATATISTATVTITNWVNNEDRLNFYNSAALQHTFNVNTSTNTAVLTLTGNATVAAYQTELQSVTYQDVNNNSPVLTPRNVTFSVTDSNSKTALATTSFNVQNVNLPPVLSGIATTPLAYTVDSAPQAIASTLLINDPDSANLTKATVQITSGYQNNSGGQDILSFVNQNGITGTFNATTGMLTLTGTSAVGNYRTALQSVTFNTTGAQISTATRTLSIIVTDGASPTPQSSAPMTRNITMTATTLPTLSGIGATTIFDAGAAPIYLLPNLVIGDSSSGTLNSATVTITNWQPSEDFLSNNIASAGLTHKYTVNAAQKTATLTITGNASLATYQTALRTIVYQDFNTSDPVTTPRVATLTVNDGIATNTATTDIIVQ